MGGRWEGGGGGEWLVKGVIRATWQHKRFLELKIMTKHALCGSVVKSQNTAKVVIVLLQELQLHTYPFTDTTH